MLDKYVHYMKEKQIGNIYLNVHMSITWKKNKSAIYIWTMHAAKNTLLVKTQYKIVCCHIDVCHLWQALMLMVRSKLLCSRNYTFNT